MSQFSKETALGLHRRLRIRTPRKLNVRIPPRFQVASPFLKTAISRQMKKNPRFIRQSKQQDLNDTKTNLGIYDLQKENRDVSFCISAVSIRKNTSRKDSPISVQEETQQETVRAVLGKPTSFLETVKMHKQGRYICCCG